MNHYIIYRQGDVSPPEIASRTTTPWKAIEIKSAEFQNMEGPGFCFRFGTTPTLPPEAKTLSVVNRAKAIHLAYNKAEARRVLQAALLPIPTTYWHGEVLDIPAPEAEKQLVVRPVHHARQSDFHLVSNLRQLLVAVGKIQGPYYISEFVEKEHEFRVHVCMGRVMAITEKVPHNRELPCWGVRYITWTNVRWGQWSTDLAHLGASAVAALGLDFGAVDIISDKEGRLFVLEVNTAPHLSSYEALTYARALDYIAKHGPQKLEPPAQHNIRSFRDIIHPVNLLD